MRRLGVGSTWHSFYDGTDDYELRLPCTLAAFYLGRDRWWVIR